jgi:hypothetical protein
MEEVIRYYINICFDFSVSIQGWPLVFVRILENDTICWNCTLNLGTRKLSPRETGKEIPPIILVKRPFL